MRRLIDFFNDDNVQAFLSIMLIIGFFTLALISYGNEKRECIEQGSKWIKGYIGGEYS